ncbi:hypothetical protein EYR40_011014 [Pleurotus pulmonarius]|nr:hypothetical protein EYR36_002782 [Pleurotus pulmonarius]KAF4586996.1 hypothetical protein EYR40_011014 [Pleurotus pulmonarius]
MEFTPINEIEKIHAELRSGANRRSLDRRLGQAIRRELLIGPCIGEAKKVYQSVDKWSKSEKPAFTFNLFAMRPVIRKEPKGVVLIISPFNYPLWLTIGPVLGALAAGNAVAIKPSENATAVSSLLTGLIPKYLDRDLTGDIFGPLLPISPVNNLGEAIAFINSRDHPLAFTSLLLTKLSKPRVDMMLSARYPPSTAKKVTAVRKPSPSPSGLMALLSLLFIKESSINNNATCRRSAGILSLPLDTLIQVLSFANPQDIIAIRKDMSLVQLEHAATTPFRFTSLLRHSSHSQQSPPSSAAQPVAIRLLQPRLPRDFVGDVGIFESSYLVPGGRFLLTRSSRNLLQVWDLGYSADMMIKPESVASHHLGDGELQFDPDAQITQDGEGLLVFLASENVFRIFEVYPLSESPAFRKVASIDVVLGGRCVYVFTSNLIIFYMNRRLTVWDYVEDNIVSWTIRSAQVWDIAVSNSHVTLLDQGGFSIYKIPPMRPRALVYQAPPQAYISPQVPLLSVQYPISSVVKVADNWSWYTSVNDTRPVHFDVLGVGLPIASPEATTSSGSSYIYSLNNPSYTDPDVADSDPDTMDDDSSNTGPNGGEALIIARYTLKKVKNHPRDGLPEYMPVLVEHVRLSGYLQPSVDNARSIRTGSRDLVLMWPSMQGKKLLVYYSDLEGSGQTSGDVPLGDTTTATATDRHDSDEVRPPRTRPRPRIASLEISGMFSGEVICCPFAGRVCSIDEQGTIHVMDYVRPVGS